MSILGFPSRANMSNYLSGLAFPPGSFGSKEGRYDDSRCLESFMVVRG